MSSELARFEERYFPGEGKEAVYVAVTITGAVRIRVRDAAGNIAHASVDPEVGLQLHQAVRTKAQRAQEVMK